MVFFQNERRFLERSLRRSAAVLSVRCGGEESQDGEHKFPQGGRAPGEPAANGCGGERCLVPPNAAVPRPITDGGAFSCPELSPSPASRQCRTRRGLRLHSVFLDWLPPAGLLPKYRGYSGPPEPPAFSFKPILAILCTQLHRWHLQLLTQEREKF